MARYSKSLQQPKATFVSKRHHTSPICMYPVANSDLTTIAPVPPSIIAPKDITTIISSVGVVRLIGSSRFSGVIHSQKNCCFPNYRLPLHLH